jgi:hypothetical protein
MSGFGIFLTVVGCLIIYVLFAVGMYHYLIHGRNWSERDAEPTIASAFWPFFTAFWVFVGGPVALIIWLVKRSCRVTKSVKSRKSVIVK